MTTHRIIAALLTGALSLTSVGVASAQSTEVGEPPGAPRNVTVEPEQRGRIFVRWDRATDDTGIRLYRIYANGIQIEQAAPSTGGMGISVTDGLKFIQIDATDLDGNVSVRSAPVSILVDTVAPSAPVAVTVDPSYISATTRMFVRFSLPRPDDVSTCTLLRNLGPTNTGTFTPQLDPDDPTRYLVVDSHAPGGDAWFQLTCADGSGNTSVRSAPVYVDVVQF